MGASTGSPRPGGRRRVAHLTALVAVAALTSGCTLWGWGANPFGQVGDGTTTTRTQPVPIGSADTWLSISAGNGESAGPGVHRGHTCAIDFEGALWCWGSNAGGRLGDGTTTDRSNPVQVGTTSDWSSVSAGRGHTCAVRGDASLWCWGGNGSGQLGDGTTTMRLEPVQVGTSAWKSVAAGASFTCAIRDDATLWCWGWNNDGQLGDGTTTMRLEPVQVGTAPWRSVATGTSHTCAVRADFRLFCWGSNSFSQLGTGFSSASIARSLTPAAVCNGNFVECLFGTAPAAIWKSVTASGGSEGSHTCAVRSDDVLFCWGWNSQGQLGVDNGTHFSLASPMVAVGGGPWRSASAGSHHTCALASDNTLWCWGRNTEGQLGDGTTTGRWTPAQVGEEARWHAVSAGGHHTHALLRPA